MPRSGAFALDYGPIALYLGALTVGSQVVAASRPDVTAALFRSPLAGQASGFLLVTVPVSLYFALQEILLANLPIGSPLRAFGP